MFKRAIIPLASLGAVLVLASIGVAGDDDSNLPNMESNKVVAIESEAKDLLAVLDEGRDSSDALPADVARAFSKRALFGMNPELSRLAIGNATHAVYVIPARDHACASLTVGEGANLSCSSIEELKAGRATPSTVTVETGIAVYGLVPDGVRSASIRVAGSSSIEVEVERNVYYAVVPAGTAIRSLAYTGPSGPVEYSISDPAEAFGE